MNSYSVLRMRPWLRYPENAILPQIDSKGLALKETHLFKGYKAILVWPILDLTLLQGSKEILFAIRRILLFAL